MRNAAVVLIFCPRGALADLLHDRRVRAGGSRLAELAGGEGALQGVVLVLDLLQFEEGQRGDLHECCYLGFWKMKKMGKSKMKKNKKTWGGGLKISRSCIGGASETEAKESIVRGSKAVKVRIRPVLFPSSIRPYETQRATMIPDSAPACAIQKQIPRNPLGDHGGGSRIPKIWLAASQKAVYPPPQLVRASYSTAGSCGPEQRTRHLMSVGGV